MLHRVLMMIALLNANSTKQMQREAMTNIPDFFVDGLLSAASHNGVHRLVFFRLKGGESGAAEPCIEISLPEAAVKSVVETLIAFSSGRAKPPRR